MLDNHLCIVFAQEHFNPLGIIRSLGEKGISPVYIAVKRKTDIGVLSKYVSHVHKVDTVEAGYQLLLNEYGNYSSDNVPIVFCTDDKTIGYLDSKYDELKGRFIFFNAGACNRINKYMNKYEILDAANKCGINTLDTIVCKKGELPSGIKYPIITKSISPNIGGWKSDVHICKNQDELIEAYKHIDAHLVLIQKYVNKKNELEYYGMSINKGKDVLISIGLDYIYNIPGYYSPYMNVFMPPYPEIQEKIKKLIEFVGYEGIFDVEFIVDQDNQIYLMEVNFRSPAWSYASTVAGVNLPYCWAEGMITKKISDEAYIEFESFKAMAEPIDYGKRVDSGKISIAQWIKEFKEVKCTYYYDENDIAPFEALYDNWEIMK